MSDENTVLVRVLPPGGPEDLSHYLLIVEGPRQGLWIQVPEEPMTLGRGSEADLDLGDRTVSSQHCKVFLESGQLIVEDLGSMNGTFIGGKAVRKKRALPVGGHLFLGKTHLKHELRSKEEVRQQEELTTELEKAAGYVRSLLPKPVSCETLSVEWSFIPCAKLGGDAFGYDWLDDDIFALYLLDACGHGTRSALHSVSVVNDLRKQSLGNVDFTRPEQVLTELNDAFQMEDHSGMYFTIWYGIYRPSSRRLTFSAAGHPPALLLDRDRSELGRLATTHPGIGLFEGISYEADDIEVPEGSRLYLYSDGSYEVTTRQGREWSLAEFLDVLGGPEVQQEGDLERVESAIRRIMWGDVFEDDYSIVITDFH